MLELTTLILLVICGVILIGALIEWDIGTLMVGIVFLILSVSSCYVTDKLYESTTEWKTDWKTNIIALKDNSDIQGHIDGGIFVTSGYINEKMYYYCMESTSEGSHMIKIPADYTYIKETNDVSPYVVKKSENWKSNKVRFWLIDINNEKYYIYVPEGTVDTTYKINME